MNTPARQRPTDAGRLIELVDRFEGRRVAVRARESGVPVTYEEWPRMPHVFPLLADLVPEARLVFGHISRFLTAVSGTHDPAYRPQATDAA